MLPTFYIDHPFFSVKVKDANMQDLLTLFRPVFLRMGIRKDQFKSQLLHIRREFYSQFVRTAFLKYLIVMRKIKRQVARRTQRAFVGRPIISEEDRKENAIVAETKLTDIVSRPRSTRRSALGPMLMGAYMRSTGIDERLRLRTAIRDRQFRLLKRKLIQLIREDTIKEIKRYNNRSDDEVEVERAKNSFALDRMLHHDGDFVRSIYSQFPLWQRMEGSKDKKTYLSSFDSWCMHIMINGVRLWERQNTLEGEMIDFAMKFDKWKKKMPILIRSAGVFATSV